MTRHLDDLRFMAFDERLPNAAREAAMLVHANTRDCVTLDVW